MSLSLTSVERETAPWQQLLGNGGVDPDCVCIYDELENMRDMDVDDLTAAFSDEDDDEGEQESGSPKHNLHLRNYQVELSKIALRGRNSIICAPTGSGKTKVAIHIILEHLKSKPDGAKIAFFARSVPLAKQQFKQIRDHLSDPTSAMLITGESEMSMSLHKLLAKYKVFVLTPMILVNHLSGSEPLIPEGLTCFSLLVFDECHHTREGEPYNNIMYYYLRQKRRSPDLPLPQVLGLTASIGVEKAETPNEAKASILAVCGNLDVDNIQVVRNHLAELRERVPVPTELAPVRLSEREKDAIISEMYGIIDSLEKKAFDCAQTLEDEEVSKLMGIIPPGKKLPEYCQWTVNLSTKAQEARINDKDREKIMALRYIIIIAEYLKAYHFALEATDLAQIEDVITFLDQCFINFKENKDKTLEEVIFYSLFTDLQDKVSRRQLEPNANLEKLAEVLREHVVGKSDTSRAIIFVRTRMLASAIVSWFKRCGERDLVALNAHKFTGTNAPQEAGGMTESQQQSAIDQFRKGEVHLLVATSVAEEGLDIPDCNLTIKYNHTGNEVTKVQMRGRSRTKDGLSVVLGMSDILQREYMNHARAKLMEEAISEISTMGSEDIRNYIEKYQDSLIREWDLEEEERMRIRNSLQDVSYSVVCPKCHTVRVKNSNIRAIYEKYRVSIDRNLLNHIKIVPKPPAEMDQLKFVGTALCLGETQPGSFCYNQLGTVFKYQNCPFVTLGIKNIVFQEGENRPIKFKQWKKVPYVVEELSSQDMLEYAKKIWTARGEN